MNPKAIGERSEAIILAAVIRRGWAASIPFGNNQRYDLIVDTGRRLARVQCKTGRIRDGAVRFNTCSANGFTHKKRHYGGAIECFAVYCPDNDKVYLVPVTLLRKSTMALRISPLAERAPRSRIAWALDYELRDDTEIPDDSGILREQPKRERLRRPRLWFPVSWPTDDKLRELVWSIGAQATGRQLGVSNVAVKKRCAARGIDTPTRGYWAKLRSTVAA